MRCLLVHQTLQIILTMQSLGHDISHGLIRWWNLCLTFLLFSVFQQPNFKQKFVALLKRFKVTDEVCTQHCVVLRRKRSAHNHCDYYRLPCLTCEGCQGFLFLSTGSVLLKTRWNLTKVKDMIVKLRALCS